jgi:hypothetical protein
LAVFCCYGQPFRDIHSQLDGEFVKRVRNEVAMSAQPSDVSASILRNNKIFYEIWGGVEGSDSLSERSATNYGNAETPNGEILHTVE